MTLEPSKKSPPESSGPWDSTEPCPFCVAGWPVAFCLVRPGEGCQDDETAQPVLDAGEQDEYVSEALDDAHDDESSEGTERAYKDARSTGRKRAAKLYPIKPGQVCDWAWRRNCGGGVFPIVGCTGRPATHRHHGPDKSTFSNEVSNVSLVCHYCHNRWHKLNNPTYPEGRPDQGSPWLPLLQEGQVLHTLDEMVPATREEIFANELLYPVDGKDLVSDDD